MLNPALRDLKNALIAARGDLVRAERSHRSPEKISKLRGRAHSVWEQLERALHDSPRTTVHFV